MKEMLPGGEYVAVIVFTQATNFETGSVALEMELAVARGPHQGERCEKKLFFPFDQEQQAKSQFTRLGGALRSLATVGEDAMGLEGSMLQIKVYYDGVGRQKVLIYKLLGRDDPKKYSR